MHPRPRWLQPDVSVVLVAAHPDDETLGFGGQLAIPMDVTFVYSTDGAPRDMRDERRLGFDDWREYAAVRKGELRAALHLTALGEIRIREIGLPDQEAALHLSRLTEELAKHLRELSPDVILTHPFEGGHPDHDATALAVHLAARNECPGVELMEFTSYHWKDGSLVAGEFIGGADKDDASIALPDDAYELKKHMINCFTTQSSFIRSLFGRTERFRAAPRYNFAARPHPGPLFYETWESGMRWERWLECIEEISDHSERGLSLRAR